MMALPQILAFAILSIACVFGLFAALLALNRSRLERTEASKRRITKLLLKGSAGRPGQATLEDADILRQRGPFMEAFIELRQSFVLEQEAIRSIASRLETMDFEAPYVRALRSRRKSERIRAASLLKFLPSQTSFCALLDAFESEQDGVARFYLASALATQANPLAIDALIGSLKGSSPTYRRRIAPLVCEFGEALRPAVLGLLCDRDHAIVSLVLRFASLHPSEELRAYVLSIAREAPSPELELEAAKALSVRFPEELESDFFLHSPNASVARVAIAALSRKASRVNLDRLLRMIAEGPPELASLATYGAADMTRKAPALLSPVLEAFQAAPAGEGNTGAKARLADLLSFRAEYYIMKLLSSEREDAKRVLEAILASGKYSDMIGFLNRNKSPEIENELLEVFRSSMSEREDLVSACRLYLNPRSLAKLRLQSAVFERSKREEKREPGKTAALAVILCLVALSFPLAFVLGHGLPGSLPLRESLEAFVLDFNRFFAWYSLAVNSIYLGLLLFSFVGARRQSLAWKCKTTGLFFKKDMLPSVSIIAPAYCEEATIIESVNSLLNLKYPDYELIVVNDGSTDETLNTLISYYSLERTDVAVDERLKTKPLRGIYRNPSIPLLTVVDKSNGGKADSLNAGINISGKDYFCGIDADSLLEGEALLAVASGALDTEREYVAAGGNIMPINGCAVERGSISRVGIPSSNVARFQTIEYIRAFMGSRIGWAFFDSLLIISGAFGLFKKDRVIEIGGYLTSSGVYSKDTVGEDMELVVRLKRSLLEKGVPHKIQYAFNANCWTEVPQSLKILRRQRDRWHRGLIDILYFHRHIMLNPRYGRIGMVAFPYFLAFEVIGPLFEAVGWVMVLLAAVLGILNPPVLLLLFVTTVLMGISVSASSLLIVEKDRVIFPLKDMAILMVYSVLENLGFRELVSLWRVGGYFSSMRKPKGWGKMVRQGFASPVIKADTK